MPVSAHALARTRAIATGFSPPPARGYAPGGWLCPYVTQQAGQQCPRCPRHGNLRRRAFGLEVEALSQEHCEFEGAD
jgi:hypothetical protein